MLLWVVAGFGLATIGFGLSRSFALSLFCLFLTGVFDNISVVIRLTLEQTITPDHLRGRVSAINYVFIGFSNEFGAFESGATAALFGPTLSVVGGGFATLMVVVMVRAIWPQLARIGPLHTLAAARRVTEQIGWWAHERRPHGAPEGLRQPVASRQRHQGAVHPPRRLEVHARRDRSTTCSAAAKATAAEGIAAVFTRLGENVKDLGEADARGAALSRRHRSHSRAATSIASRRSS